MDYRELLVSVGDRLQDSFKWLFSKKRFNFIVIHYLYLTAMIIIGSILLYPAGGMPYVDALFFAAGACTQSGLNTIDLNKLHIYQQMILYFLPMLTNPIVIHSCVVFVRLYWFEKRFQHIVEEAMAWRITKTKSRTATQGPDEERDAGTPGVNGRKIVVMHDMGKFIGPGVGGIFSRLHKKDDQEDPSSSSVEGNGDANGHESPIREDGRRGSNTNGTANGVANGNGATAPEITSDRLPEQRSPEQHIAFLESQRNPKEKALRIPGPRAFERGEKPEAVDYDDNLSRILSGRPEDQDGYYNSVKNADTVKLDRGPRNITIDEPDRSAIHHTTTHQSRVTFRRNNTTRSLGEADDMDTATTQTRSRQRPAALANFYDLMRSDTRNPAPIPYLSWQPTIGRNSAFIDLTEEQRDELGGIEYRSLKVLAKILVGYFICFHILGIITFVPWILRTDTWGKIVEADGLNRVWWAFFSSGTLFNDLGFTLTPDSFISFQTAVVPLLLGSFLIVIGNTGFPCLLRFIIWALSLCVPKVHPLYEELRFLLDHPRRCFTLLFPSSATWILFAILVILNGVDLIFYIILDLNDPAVTNVGVGYRLLDGLFQATSTRTSGTSVVNLSLLHPGIQVSYLIMMYISVFPIAISMRRTNVYEEKSLGVYGPTADEEQEEEEEGREPSYIGMHLRKQLSFDLWFVFLGLFAIAIVQGKRITDPSDYAFNLFSVLFEIVSAYGTVGLSLGYPTNNTSLSAEFATLSKLVIAAMMLRGRHRGLPYSLDRAVILPSDHLHKEDDRNASRRPRRASTTSRFPFGYSSARDDGSVGPNAPLMHSMSADGGPVPVSPSGHSNPMNIAMGAPLDVIQSIDSGRLSQKKTR